MAKTKNKKTEGADSRIQVKQTKHAVKIDKNAKNNTAGRNSGKLPNSLVILQKSASHIWHYKKLFLGITFVYLVLTILLVKGIGSSLGISEIKSSLEELLQGNSGQLTIGFTLYGLLVGGAGAAAGEAASAYQSMVLILTSLVIIWALRQTYAGKDVGVKESFYKGVYPLVPFILVITVIGLQLVPLAIGSFMLAYSGLFVSLWEQILLFGIVFLLMLLSLYWITSSTFAMYVVSLPDTRPIQSLRAAKDLVRGRRWSVLRKLLFLPFVLLIISALITVPVILFVTPLAEWVFFLLSMLALAFVHSYLYTLYRALL